MYSIVSNERRITERIKEEAYEWLYKKITDGSYDVTGKKAEKVIFTITSAQKVTPETYKSFLDYFCNEPHNYMLTFKAKKKINRITTQDLSGYFVKYNNVVLPVGFIQEIFEDDYETLAEVKEFYSQYLEGALNDFQITCADLANNMNNDIEKLKIVHRGIFSSGFKFNFYNIFKLVLIVIGLCFSMSYLISENVVGIIYASINGDISVSGDWWSIALINILIFVVFLIKLSKSIKVLFFYISIAIIKLKIKGLTSASKKFNYSTIRGFIDSLKEVNAVFLNRLTNPKKNLTISDEDFADLPTVGRDYIKLISFKPSRLEADIEKIYTNSKYQGLYVTKRTADQMAQITDDMSEEEVATLFAQQDKGAFNQKKLLWKKGIFTSVVLIIVLAFMNFPGLNSWITDIITWFPSSGEF